MKKSLFTATIAAVAITASTLSSAAPLFTDSFESGNLSSTGPSGFRWSETNKTGVVNSTTSTFGSNLFAGTGWKAYDGSYSLRFQYPAGQYMSEQRFDLGAAYKDIWLKYWIRVPTNFTHPSSSPNNEKFLALWMDAYEGSGDGPTAWLSFFNDGSGGSTLGFTYSTGQYTSATPYQQYKPFITIPGDRGRWMQIVFHVKAATNRSSNDGVIETWRRWSGESSFTKLHEAKNLNIAPPPNGPQGWKLGYLMGWANGAYADNTEWLLDEFTVSTESLLDTTAPAGTISPPSAPASLKVM